MHVGRGLISTSKWNDPACCQAPGAIRKTATLLAIVIVGIWMVSSSTATAPTCSKPGKLAVLPFRAVRTDAGTAYLGFSLAHQISTKLSYVRGIVVRPSALVRDYTKEAPVLTDVARELDVGLVLSGSYQRHGNRLRLNAQLVHVSSKEVLWKEELEGEYGEITTVPGSIAKKIVRRLQLRLSPDEKKRLQKDVATDRSAYELYLKAIALEHSTAADRVSRIHLLEQSCALDSNYAPALASLGHAYLQYAGKVGGRGDYYERAKETLHEALQVNPELPQTLEVLASLKTRTGKAEESAALLQKGLEINPNVPSFYAGLGYVYRYAGLLDESIAAYQYMQTLDSSLPSLISSQGQITKGLIYSGKHADAVASQERVKSYLKALRRAPDVKQLFYEGMIYYYSGDRDMAYALFDSAAALNPHNLWGIFGQAYKEVALPNRRRVQEITQYLEKRNIVDGERRYRLVHFYALDGNKDAALRNLKISIEGGFFNYPYIRWDPLIESLRGTKEFKTLLEQARRWHEAFKRRFARWQRE